MTLRDLQQMLLLDLIPRYGAVEAASIVRIVLEDAFFSRKRGLETVVEPDEIVLAENIRERLVLGEPVQYILGEADFFGMKFTVNPAVLIPRQETEELVAWVIEWLKTFDKPFANVLDIGLGSGCIGITLKYKMPGLALFGIDVSPEALMVARQNAERLLPGKPVQFVEADALKDATWPAEWPLFDVIVSNPPYISPEERHLMPGHVLEHEPYMALFVPENDPLVFYKNILRTAGQKLKKDGALFFECNEFYAEAVAELFEADTHWTSITIRKDINGKPRFVHGVLKP